MNGFSGLKSEGWMLEEGAWALLSAEGPNGLGQLRGWGGGQWWLWAINTQGAGNQVFLKTTTMNVVGGLLLFCWREM